MGKPFIKKFEYRPVDEELIALRGDELDGGGPQVGAPTRESVFDHWEGGAQTKYYGVTGRDNGGLEIRPIKE